MALVEKVFNGYDNVATLQLYDDSTGTLSVSDLSSTTRVVLLLANGETVDSDTAPTALTWDSGDGKLDMQLGLLSLEEGKHSTQLVIYSDSHPNGTVWQPKFYLHVQ